MCFYLFLYSPPLWLQNKSILQLRSFSRQAIDQIIKKKNYIIMSGGGSKRALLVSDSATKIGYMRDILKEILSKLPVDYVLSFKLVVKLWYKLIKEPDFARLHFSFSLKTPKFILYLCDDECKANENLSLMDIEGKISPYVTLPPRLYQNCYMKLICSFNGLIFFTRLVEGDDLSIQICNPATQEILTVPRESEGSDWNYEMYTPDGGEWTRFSEVVKCPLPNPSCPLFPTHVCVGGRIYWLVWSGEKLEYILSIDMDGNLTRVELPGNDEERLSGDELSEDDEEGFNIFTFLIDYEGCLGLVSVDDEEIGVVVWSLKDHNASSWSFQWCVSFPISSYVEDINSIVSVGKQLLFVMKSGSDPIFCFWFLDVAKMRWKRYHSAFRVGEWRPVAFPFVETLYRCGGDR